MLFVFFLVVKMSQEESKWANSIYFGELSLHLGSLLRLKWRLLYCQDIQVRDRRQVPEIGLQWPLFNNPFGTHTSETDDVVLAIILYPQTSWVLWCFMTFPGSVVFLCYEVNGRCWANIIWWIWSKIHKGSCWSCPWHPWHHPNSNDTWTTRISSNLDSAQRQETSQKGWA